MFDWINDIVQAILIFVPRIVIVRATHGGVKWRTWFRSIKIIEMKPGLHIYWPLTTDIEIIVTARQTLETKPQGLLTKDLKSISVGAIIVYRIPDVVKAIGGRNWDVDTTVNDITKAAIVDVVTQWSMSDLMENITEKVGRELTLVCRNHLRKFGVYVQTAHLCDYTTSRTLNIQGIELASR